MHQQRVQNIREWYEPISLRQVKGEMTKRDYIKSVVKMVEPNMD